MLKRFLAGGLMVLLVAACQPQQPEALPTLIPTTAPIAAPTTAVPEKVETPVPTVPRERPTLPPTFTPTQEETATPTVTETPIEPTAFNPPATLPAGCDTFLISDNSRSVRFNLGESPTVSWAPAGGAIRYRLKLAEASGRVLNENIYIAETTYTFDGSLFVKGTFYGWEVYPINEAGDQMCLAQGGELNPVSAPGQ